MGIVDSLFSINKKKSKDFENVTKTESFKMITETGNGFYIWNGSVYKSDIVRACIRPKVSAVGKLLAKHIKNNGENVVVNDIPYLKLLLEEPNPYMTMQVLLEKVTTQLTLNNNAFILIVRDEMGVICQLFPMPVQNVEVEYKNQEMYYKFIFTNGKGMTVHHKDIIHIRQDINDNDVFGESPASVLISMMDIICTIDQGIIQAIKNGSAIKWLLRFSNSMRPEDIKEKTKEFAESFLRVESGTFGVAGYDPKMEVERVEPKDYVPNAAQIDRITKRMYAFFSTNEKIVNSSFNEDEWTSYFESVIEPIALHLSNEFTRKIFTPKQRAEGNKIYFEASNLQCASINTKLGLVQMVDRGALTPNEWRSVFNLPPVEGGDEPIRRLDTDIVNNYDE